MWNAVSVGAVRPATAAADPEVIDRLLERRVVIAGPTTLFAPLMNVASLMTEHRALQQADQILDEARELHRRMVVFVSHLRAIGSALGKTVSVFNDAVGEASVILIEFGADSINPFLGLHSDEEPQA